jgi:PPOX class probable F420-dependent enzyme
LAPRRASWHYQYDVINRTAHEFLSETRLGMLATLDQSGAPVVVPVWFEWDGARARVFSGGDTGKVRRLRADARASLLVANQLGEQERWVAIDGTIEVLAEGGIELAERLARRYWDLTDESHAAELERWRSHPERLVLLELTPERVRTNL